MDELEIYRWSPQRAMEPEYTPVRRLDPMLAPAGAEMWPDIGSSMVPNPMPGLNYGHGYSNSLRQEGEAFNLPRVLPFPKQPERPAMGSVPGMGVLRNENLPPYARQDRFGGQTPIVGKNLSFEDLTRWQMNAESSGNYTALNRQKKNNTASGAYQYTDGTWNNYGGYPKAMLAPKAVQDRRYKEDLLARIQKHKGDPFKAAAEHYLPALASRPEQWGVHYKFANGHSVEPVSAYLRKVFRGTELAGPLEDYLRRNGVR